MNTDITTDYDYDAANRLIEETRTLGTNEIDFSIQYQYDQNGNRTREIRGSQITRYTYNQNDQLTDIDYGDYITEEYTYDTRGNLTSVDKYQGISFLATTASYTYDARNQLTQASVLGTGTATFEYDYAGRRIQQVASTTATTTTNYLWDEFSRFGDVVRETDENGLETMSYTLAGGMLIAQTNSAGTDYFLQDAIGSTRALTNSGGTVTDTFDYDAFGNLLGNPTSLATNYLYTGQQYDATTDLYSLRARYYDPNVGRFLSRDTWAYDYGNPIELNRYGYVANNPVNMIDPSGYSGVTGRVSIENSNRLASAAYQREMNHFKRTFVSGFTGGILGWLVGKIAATAILSLLSSDNLFDNTGIQWYQHVGNVGEALYAGLIGSWIALANANAFATRPLTNNAVNKLWTPLQALRLKFMGIGFSAGILGLAAPIKDWFLTPIYYDPEVGDNPQGFMDSLTELAWDMAIGFVAAIATGIVNSNYVEISRYVKQRARQFPSRWVNAESLISLALDTLVNTLFTTGSTLIDGVLYEPDDMCPRESCTSDGQDSFFAPGRN